MCEISERCLSITLQPSQVTPDAFHCSVFKSNEGRTEINSTLIIPYSGGTLNVVIPYPEENLDDWKFCALGYTRQTQSHICQKIIPLTSLIHNSTVTF
jgi:hypothetical protein